MKIDIKDFNKALEEFKVPYSLGQGSDAKDLMDRLEEEKAQPFEFIHYLFREWGPDKVVNSVMCSKKAWDSFVDFRRARMAETAIRVGLEKHRLQYLLGKGVPIRDILTSELETFFTLLKYILARIGELDDLVELYEKGAIYELKSKPELKKHLNEFGDRYFPKI